MEKLQVPWRLVFQPLQPLGRQSLSKSWQSAGDRSQRPLLEDTTREGLPGDDSISRLGPGVSILRSPSYPAPPRLHDLGLPWAWVRRAAVNREGWSPPGRPSAAAAAWAPGPVEERAVTISIVRQDLLAPSGENTRARTERMAQWLDTSLSSRGTGFSSQHPLGAAHNHL